MIFQDILNSLKNAFTPAKQELFRQPDQVRAVAPSPTPTPVPMYRNPKMPQFQKQNPGSFNEILSAVSLATQNAQKRQLMMDLALEESGMRTKPPANPGSSAAGPWQFIRSTAGEYGLDDPTNATASARAVSKILDQRGLKRWEVLKKGGATQTPLESLYSPQELAPYLR